MESKNLIASKNIVISKNLTGLIYDDDSRSIFKHMILHKNNGPETGERLTTIMEKLETKEFFIIPPRHATFEELSFFHTPEHILYIQSIKNDDKSNYKRKRRFATYETKDRKAKDEIKNKKAIDGEKNNKTINCKDFNNDKESKDQSSHIKVEDSDRVEYNDHTAFAASIAAGSTCALVEAILQGKDEVNEKDKFKDDVKIKNKSEVKNEGKDEVEIESKYEMKIESESKDKIEIESKGKIEIESESKSEIESKGKGKIEIESEGKGKIEIESKVKIRNGFAIVRPPGHHAEANSDKGFCIYNNIVIAAKMALNKYGLKRILIVDWDIHHGNGTQRAFYDDPRVLYFSIHRYDFGDFYPFSKEANYDYIGYGKGKGFNVNVPWNIEPDFIGDPEYEYVWEKLLLPLAREFNPELILVSAGFDAAAGDPLGECNITPACFGKLTQQLRSIFTAPENEKLAMVLEGGYNLDIIGNCLAECLHALSDPFVFEVKDNNSEESSKELSNVKDLGDVEDLKDLSDTKNLKDIKDGKSLNTQLTPQIGKITKSTDPNPNAKQTVETVIEMLVPYWSCFSSHDIK